MERTKYVLASSGITKNTVINQASMMVCIQSLMIKYDSYDRRKTLWMLGVDPNGYSVSVGIEDFNPSFLVAIPSDWAEEEYEDLIFELQEKINKTLARPTFGDDEEEEVIGKHGAGGGDTLYWIYQ